MNILALIFSEYFHLRQTVPLIIYVFYARFRDEEHQVIEAILKMALIAIGMGTLYTIMGYILKIPLKNLIPAKLAYPTPITWGIFFLIYYYILNRKEENNLASFTLATLATVGGGWLYEVPYFHPMSMFLSRGAFFYVNAQIICLILLGYELRKKNFKINTLIISTFILYLAFSIPLFLDMRGFWRKVRDILGTLNNLYWIYRIPASLFLLSLLSGIKKKSEMMKNEMETH